MKSLKSINVRVDVFSTSVSNRRRLANFFLYSSNVVKYALKILRILFIEIKKNPSKYILHVEMLDSSKSRFNLMGVCFASLCVASE